MSENSSEYLKRTCLICGCHTNQTINIYEPRSGPNIVQLIQAKFKFQPLNEDKYLCFSCNNWLINWHSLQALNSNDAESPSGTFRSHLNSGNVMQDEKSSGSKRQIAICRPIAQVRPTQLQDSEEELVEPPSAAQQHTQQSSLNRSNEESESKKSGGKINFNKRNFRLQLARRRAGRMKHKSMQQCTCGKIIVVRCTKNSMNVSSKGQQCRKCRDFSRLKACYMRSIIQVEKELSIREPPLFGVRNPHSNLVIETEEQSSEIQTDNQSIHNQQQQPPQQHQQHQQQRQYLPKPTVDGKVVSMLRRLGTTLSREPQENGRQSCVTTTTTTTNKNNNSLPQIMSPTKPKSKWLRPLEDDEILVNFDSSISEVLPTLADQFTHVNSIAARKRLTFQVSETAEVIDLCEEDDEEEEQEELEVVDNEEKEEVFMNIEQQDFKSTYNLPKGLTITLV